MPTNTRNQHPRVAMIYDSTLETGAVGEARWTVDGRAHRCRARLLRKNAASLRVVLTEAESGGRYPAGREIVVPRPRGSGIFRFSVNNCFMPTPLSTVAIAEEMRRRGFACYLAAYGPLPLERFNPYGMSPGGANHRPGDEAWEGLILGEDKVMDFTAEPIEGLALGGWTFTKAPASCGQEATRAAG
jgi:hypothetical protein